MGPGGKVLKQRAAWTPQPDGRVRQFWEQSADGGHHLDGGVRRLVPSAHLVSRGAANRRRLVSRSYADDMGCTGALQRMKPLPDGGVGCNEERYKSFHRHGKWEAMPELG